MIHSVTAPVPVAWDAYLFDMDGTIYLGDELLPGVAAVLEALAATGRRRAFITNNTTRTRAEYAGKLRGLGLDAAEDDVVTAGTLTAAWIASHRPGAVCFVLGERPLIDEFTRAGIGLSDDPSEITLVVSSYDRTFEYRKLRVAFDALRDRPQVGFIATHADPYCPFPGGRGEPDAAAITAAIEACTGRTCQQVIGKPSAAAVTTALELLGVPAERALVVGDRLRTDIAMGRAAGAATALVLGGDTSLAQVSAAPPSARPDYVLQAMDALLPALG